jgi:hypothetical protein
MRSAGRAVRFRLAFFHSAGIENHVKRVEGCLLARGGFARKE